MAVTIRLSRHGQTKRPFYRIVAANKEAWRDGRFLEIVGHYNPMVNPPVVSLKEDKIRAWLERGAVGSPIVNSLIKKNIPGLLEERATHKLKKVQAARKLRKERAKKAGVKKPAKTAKKAAKAAAPKKPAVKKAKKA